MKRFVFFALLFFVQPSYAHDKLEHDATENPRSLSVLKALQPKTLKYLQLPYTTSPRQSELGYSLGPKMDENSIAPVWVAPSSKLKPWFDVNCQKIASVCLNEIKPTVFRGMTIAFTLGSYGTILNPQFLKKSDSESNDALALKILHTASPLTAPPKALKEMRLSVIFDWPTVDMQVDLRSAGSVTYRAIDLNRSAKP